MVILSKRTKDLTGQRFGSLVAIKPSHKKSNMVYWEFKCDCGNTHVARGNTVVHQAKKAKQANLPSCGCVELANKTKHGFRKAKDTHPAYKAYRAMMERCYDKNCPNYKWYCALGVTVCDDWRGNPEAFIKWAINNGWKKGLHLDKDILCKENNITPAIYSPQTCQWVKPQVNVAFATNRDNYGKHPNVRLSHAQVKEIEHKYFSGEVTNKSELARQYGLLSPSSIGRIIRLAKKRKGLE